MKEKPQIGQTLYSLNIGNAARGVDQVLTPLKVIKIGRKYFTAGVGWRETQFHLSDWREKTEYSSNQKLYISEQEYLEEKEEGEICTMIWKAFDYRKNIEKISLNGLREIARIIKNKDV